MGSVRTRADDDGNERYVALYRDVKGRQRSAGTYATKRQAERAWQRAEDRLAEGRLGDPARGKRVLRRYVEDEWLPNHEIEARTRENYGYYLKCHIIPHFGSMRMVDILPSDVRDWKSALSRDGISPHVIRSSMAILSAIFTTALNDQITQLHPCKGVTPPPLIKKQRAVVTPEQFDRLYAGLVTETARLLVEFDVETGLRWGELTELRPADIDFPTRILTVSRVVEEVVPKRHPSGKRFIVRHYPKDKEHRRLKLSTQIIAKVEEYIKRSGLGPHDLLFSIPELPPKSEQAALDPESLGLTEPNKAGRQYQHGTISGYSTGGCRCPHCKRAYADYRAARRAAGKDQPRQRRTVDTDGHIPRRWFRDHIWVPATEAATLNAGTRVHDLRHAHASWLLSGGADLQVVKERLGHASIRTTEKYLHTLPTADETALNALDRARNGAAPQGQRTARPRPRRNARRRP